MSPTASRRRVLTMLGGSVAATSGVSAAGAAVFGGTGPRRVPDRPFVAPPFRHERLDPNPPAPRLGYLEASDLTDSGRPDLVVAGKGAPTNLWLFGRRTRVPSADGLRYRVSTGDPTVFWYENPGWQRHAIASVPHLSEGGALGDITGSGRADLVVGQSLHYRSLYWFEQPEDLRAPWPRYRITDDFEMYHDVAVADVDDDGDPEVVALSQRGRTLFYYDVPRDPRRTPWPRERRHVVMRGTDTKGLAVVDIDGDGRTELIAGNSIYRRTPGNDGWTRERFAHGFEQPRIEVADIDGDGDREIVASEGDSPWLGTHPGRLAWFDPPDWDRRLLRSDLFCPHSLGVADLDGDGRLDVVVGEMGLGRHESPTLYAYLGRGDGTFEERVVSRGIPTHEATLVDLTGNGRPDVVGKSYHPESHVDVWYNGW